MNSLKKVQPRDMAIAELMAWADKKPGHWQLRDGEPEPVVLIEILSPSNRAQTSANVWAYASIPTVAEIIIVSSLTVSAEILRRLPDGTWPAQPELVGSGGQLVIERIGFDRALIDAYATTDLVG